MIKYFQTKYCCEASHTHVQSSDISNFLKGNQINDKMKKMIAFNLIPLNNIMIN